MKNSDGSSSLYETFSHHSSMQHQGRLTGLSGELGKRARTNSEQLLYVTRTHEEWSRDPERVHITPGSVTITSGVWPDAVTSVEPTNWGVGSDVFALLGTYHQHDAGEMPTDQQILKLRHIAAL